MTAIAKNSRHDVTCLKANLIVLAGALVLLPSAKSMLMLSQEQVFDMLVGYTMHPYNARMHMNTKTIVYTGPVA